jgi:hypothetical protein
MRDDLDVIRDALAALKSSGLCTDRDQLNRAWRDLSKPEPEQGDLDA